MIKILLIIIILGLIAAAAIPIIKLIRRKRLEAALRENPPNVVRFKVRLPPDSDKSNTKMTRFWDRIHRQLPTDDESMEKNENVLHMAIIGEGSPIGQAPSVSFMVWCSPTLAERVEVALSECYENDAEITELPLEKDPIGSYVEAVRQQKAFEQARQDELRRVEQERRELAARAADDDDD